MSLVITCNLPTGVILGVDGNVIVPSFDGKEVIAAYEGVDNLFQLGQKPIGIATYGYLKPEGVGKFIPKFEEQYKNLLTSATTVEEVAKLLLKFFGDMYAGIEKPEQLDEDNPLKFGLVVAGFSDNETSSEVWNIEFSQNQPTICLQVIPQGTFELARFGSDLPIYRLRDQNQTPDINSPLISAMPIETGIEYTNFLVELVINYYKFIDVRDFAGGKTQIGFAINNGEPFKILEFES